MQLELILAEIAPTSGWGAMTGLFGSFGLNRLFSMTFTEAQDITLAQQLLAMEHNSIRGRLASITESNGDPCWDILPQSLYVAALRNIMDAAAYVGWDALPDLGKPPLPREGVPSESCERLREWSECVLEEAIRLRDKLTVD